mmetsp:Transcript_7671/g.20332  ORF Transcript_7671/g.20332 Transcript_7671/m.20332 type:complete len:133 (+) Transcript_7671:1177-1575(+)
MPSAALGLAAPAAASCVVTCTKAGSGMTRAVADQLPVVSEPRGSVLSAVVRGGILTTQYFSYRMRAKDRGKHLTHRKFHRVRPSTTIAKSSKLLTFGHYALFEVALKHYSPILKLNERTLTAAVVTHGVLLQ